MEAEPCFALRGWPSEAEGRKGLATVDDGTRSRSLRVPPGRPGHGTRGRTAVGAEGSRGGAGGGSGRRREGSQRRRRAGRAGGGRGDGVGRGRAGGESHSWVTGRKGPGGDERDRPRGEGARRGRRPGPSGAEWSAGRGWRRVHPGDRRRPVTRGARDSATPPPGAWAGSGTVAM